MLDRQKVKDSLAEYFRQVSGIKKSISVFFRVRKVKQLTHHVVMGSCWWAPTNGNQACWLWCYQSAICICG